MSVDRQPEVAQLLDGWLEELEAMGELPASRLALIRRLRQELELDLFAAKQAVDEYCAALPPEDTRVSAYPHARPAMQALGLLLLTVLAVAILGVMWLLPVWARVLFVGIVLALHAPPLILRLMRRFRARRRARNQVGAASPR
jgi:hypothetical protein